MIPNHVEAMLREFDAYVLKMQGGGKPHAA